MCSDSTDIMWDCAMVNNPLNPQQKNSKECLLIGFNAKIDMYSWPNMLKLDIKQKFIHWATRGRL